MPSTSTNPRRSAVPTVYYVIFGIIEPLMTFLSLLEGIFDPGKILNRYGCGSSGFPKASEALPTKVHAFVCRMVVAYATVGCVNASVLRTIRSLPSPALQEKIVRSLLISLAIGDVLHQVGTLYWVCDVRRKTIKDWPQALWLSVVVGTALFTLRICWLVGIGRYVETRDARLDGRN